MTSTTKLIVTIIIALVVLGGGVLFALNGSKSDSSNEQPIINSNDQSNSTTETTEDSAELAEAFTAAQVAEHNTESDCWTIISGSVYNLTSFISRHPGGEEILRACGTDATTLFTSRTTTDGETVGSGTGHSNSAASQLAELKIGELVYLDCSLQGSKREYVGFLV